MQTENVGLLKIVKEIKGSYNCRAKFHEASAAVHGYCHRY